MTLVGEAMSFIDRLTSPGEIYVLLVTFVFTKQFDRNLDLEVVQEGAIKDFLEISHSFLDALTNHMQPIGAVFFAYTFMLIVLRLLGKKVRKLIDTLACFLTVCWIVELVIMNLLLIAPIKSPVLLIVELLLFIPIILICFTWWYWRINHGRAAKNMLPAIVLVDGPSALEYFFFAAEVCFDYSQELCKTSVSKMVRLLNGFVVLDVFGLTLSRAVDLAIG
tara:strand:- start:637 stop:1299 length:663 start_codon:yes stop_codon:yes gene_type:complete